MPVAFNTKMSTERQSRVPRTAKRRLRVTKKSFRKLGAPASIHDSSNWTKKIAGKFKESIEAYEVLVSRDRRKKYDELGANWKSRPEFRLAAQPAEFRRWTNLSRGRRHYATMIVKRHF